jgi:hypothetical protein
MAGAAEQTGRLPAWSQGAANQGVQQHAAFIEEGNGGPLATRLF